MRPQSSIRRCRRSSALTAYNPKIPLRIFSAEGYLIGEFGEERRAVVKIADVPEPLRQAILAAEDERFYEHGGVDYIGVLRAMLSQLLRRRRQTGRLHHHHAGGAQLLPEQGEDVHSQIQRGAARPSRSSTASTKDQILELYINQIYLGQRAYGFASAAQVYFGKNLRDLNLAEIAMLAGLPKAPVALQPCRQYATREGAAAVRICAACASCNFITASAVR